PERRSRARLRTAGLRHGGQPDTGTRRRTRTRTGLHAANAFAPRTPSPAVLPQFPHPGGGGMWGGLPGGRAGGGVTPAHTRRSAVPPPSPGRRGGGGGAPPPRPGAAGPGEGQNETAAALGG